MFHFFYSLCSCCVFCKTIKWSRNQETQGKFQVLIKMFQHPAGHGFSSFCTWKINVKSLFSSNISASGKLRCLKLASSQILTSTCTVSQSVMFSNAGNENHSAELWSLVDYSEHVFFFNLLIGKWCFCSILHVYCTFIFFFRPNSIPSSRTSSHYRTDIKILQKKMPNWSKLCMFHCYSWTS